MKEWERRAPKVCLRLATEEGDFNQAQYAASTTKLVLWVRVAPNLSLLTRTRRIPRAKTKPIAADSEQIAPVTRTIGAGNRRRENRQNSCQSKIKRLAVSTNLQNTKGGSRVQMPMRRCPSLQRIHLVAHSLCSPMPSRSPSELPGSLYKFRSLQGQATNNLRFNEI